MARKGVTFKTKPLGTYGKQSISLSGGRTLRGANPIGKSGRGLKKL